MKFVLEIDLDCEDIPKTQTPFCRLLTQITDDIRSLDMETPDNRIDKLDHANQYLVSEWRSAHFPNDVSVRYQVIPAPFDRNRCMDPSVTTTEMTEQVLQDPT